MNKVYYLATESSCKVPYVIEIKKFSRVNGQWQFDARVAPPKGHSLSLENVRYTDEGEIKVPRGSGFTLELTRRLRDKLTSICKELSKLEQEVKERKPKKKREKRKAPKLFDRSASEELKERIIKGELNETT
jgi:hypothetical protein